MKLYDQLQAGLEKHLSPVAQKLAANKVLQAISGGMMLTLPLTLGASVFLILANFPVAAVSDFLASIGLTPHMSAIANGTMNILGLVVSFTVAYNYAKNLGGKGVIAGLLSLSSFLILLPQTVGEGDAATPAFALSYLGSSGLFVAIALALLSARLYVALTKSGKLTIKLPESVPPMVSSSIEPVFVGMIIYLLVMFVRLGMAMTPFGNVFDFFSQIIAAPLMSVGGSVPALLLIYTFCNLLFFFGIHPSPVQAIGQTIAMGMILTGVDQMAAGETIQYLDNIVVFDFVNNDATGSTLSLLIAILLVAKSARYRTMAKVSIVPNAFSINEPVIFGMPIMFNASLFIPFVLSSIVSGLMGLLGLKLGLLAGYTPSVAMAMPWTLPKFIASFFVYGWGGFVWRVVTMLVLVALYLPFVKLMDKQELAGEQDAPAAADEIA